MKVKKCENSRDPALLGLRKDEECSKVSLTRKTLQGCRSLKDLKARLGFLRSPSKSQSANNSEKLKQSPNDVLLEFDLSPAKSAPASPLRGSPLAKNLRHDVPAPVSPTPLYRDVEMKVEYDPFPLPGHMIRLESHFKDFDSAVAFVFNRCPGPMTFENVRGVVRKMSGWNVCHTKVAQFKAVFPDAMKFEKTGDNPNLMELEPVIEQDDFTPTVLVRRRVKFHGNLVEIAKTHHDAFLNTLKPPISLCLTEVRRWHPLFRYDQIPTVKPDAAYPFYQGGHSNAVEGRPSVVRSLFRDENPSEASTSGGGEIFSDSFVAKIRQREADNNLRYITRSDEEAKKLRMMNRLVEVAKMLPSVFVTEKTNALDVNLVCDRLIASYPALFTRDVLVEHLALLSDEMKPTEDGQSPLVSLTTLKACGSTKILRLDRNVHYSVLQKRINERIAVLEKQ